MKRILISAILSILSIVSVSAASDRAAEALLERVCPGSKGRIVFNRIKSDPALDFFEIDMKGGKPRISGNNSVSLAVGLNWYLKYCCGIHLSWNHMSQPLPEVLPVVSGKVRKETPLTMRYDFNYCTFSYSMPFWDWSRWEKEIDWMALHGINMPLAIVGMESAWRNMLRRLGYSDKEIGDFIAGPAFIAWWAMNNLEGWGGPSRRHGMPTASSCRKKFSPE